MSPNQSINQVLREPSTFQNFASVVGFTGTTNTAVLLFQDANSSDTGRGFQATNSATLGTVLTIVQAGIYALDLFWSFTGAVSVGFGIGLNLAAAPIVADPAWATAGIVAALDPLTGAAAVTYGGVLSTKITVPQSLVNSGAIVHFLATNSAGAAPVGLIAASMAYRATKIADLD